MWKYIIYNQSQEKQNKDWNWIQSFIKREYKKDYVYEYLHYVKIEK